MLSLSLSLLLPYYHRTLSQSQYIYLKKMEESEEIPVPQQSGEVRPVPRLLCFLSETAPANAKKAKLTKMNSGIDHRWYIDPRFPKKILYIPHSVPTYHRGRIIMNDIWPREGQTTSIELFTGMGHSQV